MQNSETKTISMPRQAWSIIDRIASIKKVDRSKATQSLVLTAARRNKDEEVTKLLLALDSRRV